MNPRAVPVLFGAIGLGAAVWGSWLWDTDDYWDLPVGALEGPYRQGQVIGCALTYGLVAALIGGAIASGSGYVARLLWQRLRSPEQRGWQAAPGPASAHHVRASAAVGAPGRLQVACIADIVRHMPRSTEAHLRVVCRVDGQQDTSRPVREATFELSDIAGATAIHRSQTRQRRRPRHRHPPRRPRRAPIRSVGPPPSPRKAPVMIEAHELTKRYGDKTAVHTLSFTIAPGTVTRPGWWRPARC